MKISARTIERLTKVIAGDNEKSPYRIGTQIADFFRHVDGRDEDWSGCANRTQYVRMKLMECNGTDLLSKIIPAAFDFFGEDGFDPEEQADDFNPYLVRDGYRLAIRNRSGRLESDPKVKVVPHFEIEPLAFGSISPEGIATISPGVLNEHISKANSKIASGDFAGAIASSYTLVEHLQKIILREAGVEFNDNEGSIEKLHRLVGKALNLNPAQENMDPLLKPILSGLQKVIAGLYTISNQASDRHARRYNPAVHHAQLVVNAAFAYCTFLVESQDYQRAKDALAAEESEDWSA